MSQELAQPLENAGFRLYPRSVRQLPDGSRLFVAGRGDDKFVGLCQRENGLRLDCPMLAAPIRTPSSESVSLYKLDRQNYNKLRAVIPISPSPCDRNASFGTGDRLGLVSAAHLDAHARYPVFPIIAQQSPRELTRTNRSFKSVLLDAVMGVLESGYTGKFGADADHIKDEHYLKEGVEAGYSMFTLDVSEWLQDLPAGDVSELKEKLSPLSRSIIAELAGTNVQGTDYVISQDELLTSAIIYEKSMEQVKRFNEIIKSGLADFDLEVSIDEGSRDTTAEDHLFVAEYLHRSGIDFKSLAPKFPGEFQKAVDYDGDVNALAESLRVHAALSKMLEGYRLSLHSGSDKFSVYKLFGDTTGGNFHIKTSGTSWVMAVKLVASANPELFRDLYSRCLDNLMESKKAYHVYITPEHFPSELPHDLLAFYDIPDVRQLFHISYGVLLDARKSAIYETLRKHEQEHYGYVSDHIARHLDLLFQEGVGG